MPSFSNSLEDAVHASLALANTRRHEFADLEHLLLALLEEPDAKKVVQACAVDIEELKETLNRHLDTEFPKIEPGQGAESIPTAAFQRVIQRAAIHVQSSGRTEVNGANVLVAIFAERTSHAAELLVEREMYRYDAVNFIAHGVAKDPAHYEFRPIDDSEEPEKEFPESEELLTESEWREKFAKEQETTSITEKTKVAKERIRTANVVFISYSSADRELVEGFKEHLTQNGIPTWWDQDIKPGAAWRTEIADRLEDSSLVLTLWTANSTKSKPVIEEASSAQSKKKLVHVRFDRSAIPYGFAETQYVDMTDWDGTDRHPNFEKLLFAIKDKLTKPNASYAEKRLATSNPTEMVASQGKLTLKDSPANVRPPIVNPSDLKERLFGLAQTVSSMCNMCGHSNSFQLPHTLPHCLEALRLALTTEPVTWYALDDAKSLLCDCMEDNYAQDTWNSVVYKGLSNLIVRIEEIRPLLQPRQINPSTEESKPPSPEPIVPQNRLDEVGEIVINIRKELATDEAEDALSTNTKQAFDSAVVQLDEASKSTGDNEKKLARVRRSLKRVAYLAGGLITAVGTGVTINLLTSPSAALTLSSKLQPIYDAIIRFFL